MINSGSLVSGVSLLGARHDVIDSEEEDGLFISCFINNVVGNQDFKEPDPPPEVDSSQESPNAYTSLERKESSRLAIKYV